MEISGNKLLWAGVLALGVSGAAFAGGDGDMNPFTGESWAYLRGLSYTPGKINEWTASAEHPVAVAESPQNSSLAKIEDAEQAFKMKVAHVHVTPHATFNDNTAG
jgi:hypothetical protein